MKRGDTGADRTERGAVALCLAFVCALTLIAYSRSFHSAFHLDDYSQIVGNPVMATPGVQSVLHFGRARIIPFVTLVANYQLGGEEPFGFHLVNFAVHLLATFAVFALALALCRTPRLRGTRLAEQPLVFATAAAFVFACHPIQIQAVTYIVQRMSSMAALFYVGSVFLYVRARNAQIERGPSYAVLAFAGSAALAFAAFLSKENAASLPVAILLVELAFYPGERAVRRLVRLLPFAALVLSIPIVWQAFGRRPNVPAGFGVPLGRQIDDLVAMLIHRARRGTSISSTDYLLTQATVIPRYLKMVVAPWGFNVDHDVPIARELSVPVLAGAVALIALFGGGLFALRRAPLVGFGILWIFVALSVESSILPIKDVMVEHRMYLAMPGIALMAGLVFVAALRAYRMPALVGAASCVVVLVSLTIARNEVWRTHLGLWQDALAKSPGKARVHANLGTALHDLGRLDEAIAEYCAALAIDPNHDVAKTNLQVAVDDEVEKKADADEDIEAVIGPDGSLLVGRRDPCAKKIEEKKKGEG